MKQLQSLSTRNERELQIEPPTPGRIERLVRSSIYQHENDFCHQTLSKLTPGNLKQIDILLTTEEPNRSEEKETPGKLKSTEFRLSQN